VILMDLGMPEINGIEATRTVLRTSSHISILVISMQEDDDSVFAALQAGARGDILKGSLKAEILRSIRAVVSGEAIFGPAIARRLMQYFAAPRSNTPPDAFPELTEREREILALIARYETNPEIAKRLHLSPKTVHNHVLNIFTKLQVADRAQAIIRAREAGGSKLSANRANGLRASRRRGCGLARRSPPRLATRPRRRGRGSLLELHATVSAGQDRRPCRRGTTTPSSLPSGRCGRAWTPERLRDLRGRARGRCRCPSGRRRVLRRCR
jgi:DNA-binding NarL/FixJ family response regulator